MRIDPARATPLWLCYYDNLLGSSASLWSPSLRFDLAGVPKDSVVRRALLRLRRGHEQLSDRTGPRSYPVFVTNANKGLRIRRAEVDDAWQHPGTIHDAEPVSEEGALWPPTGGLEYIQAVYQGRPYVAWLREWNRTSTTRLAPAAEWDEIDVTAMVQEELRGDRSITIVLSSEAIMHVGWFDSDPKRRLGLLDNRPEFRPHLVIEVDGAAKKEVVPDRHVSGRISIRSTPAPAKVYLDAEFVGTTLADQPVEFPVSSPRVRVRLEKRGFKPWEETIRLSDSAATPLHAELDPE